MSFLKKSKKILVCLFVIFLVFSILAPTKKVEAQPTSSVLTAAQCSGLLDELGGWLGNLWSGLGGLLGFGGEVPVKEEQDRTKEGCLDQIAWTIANELIEDATRETINWINGTSPGSGGPKYVRDLEGFLADVADETIGEFIYNSPFGFVCDPFRPQLRLSLARLHIPDDRAICTLSEIVDNVDNFIQGDFYDGGWDAWGELVTRSNPYAQFLRAESELSAKIQARQDVELAKLQWGGGFLSWEVCPGEVYECVVFGPPDLNGDLPRISVANEAACQAAQGNWQCVEQPQIVTPGSVIEDQLNEALSSGQDRLIVADEFNEIVSALMNRLVNDIFSQSGNPNNPGGLFGVNQTQASRGRTGTNPVTGNDLCSQYGICNNGSPGGGPGGGTSQPPSSQTCVEICQQNYCDPLPQSGLQCNPSDPQLLACINACFTPPPSVPPGGGIPPGGPGPGGCFLPGPTDAPLPNRLSVVQAVANEFSSLLQNSCLEFGGNWGFMDEVVSRLHAQDPRWGYNGKRGNINDPSEDAISYYYGPGSPTNGDNRVYIIDIIVGHCGPNPQPAWINQTNATCQAGTVGAYKYPR